MGPTARVRASPHGCRPYRAPLRFTSVRGTGRGAGTPSRLWIGWREGASPLIRRGRASGFEAGSRARPTGAAPALPVARAPALCPETYFGWIGQLTHPEFGSEVLALPLRGQTLMCVVTCRTFTPRALLLEVLSWARATLSRPCGAVRLSRVQRDKMRRSVPNYFPPSPFSLGHESHHQSVLSIRPYYFTETTPFTFLYPRIYCL